MRTQRRMRGGSRAGNATVVAILVMLVIGGMVGVVLTVTQRHTGEISALADQNRAFFVAQGGVNEALSRLEAGEFDLGEGEETSLGDQDEPLTLSGGRYWVTVACGADGLYTLTSHARAGLQKRGIEVVVQQESEGIYNNAIFAGNSSEDPSYALRLSGKGTQADQVTGNVYSGGSVSIEDDANVDGVIRAYDSAKGNGSDKAETGKRQAIPDLAGMNYSTTADVMVAKEFASATYASSSAGGKAWQMPEENPAHIFRKNPSDRTSETGGTVKDDYFLEDPYEPVGKDSNSDGTDAYGITLSGVSGEPGTSSNHKVFYIDGNLWIHNYPTMSFKFKHSDPNGIQVTFVVKGNIYISDNIFYSNDDKDGVAFIAMKDESVADSGNIYFGDPKFGTLENMHAFLYAENNFLDVNLDAKGSAIVELHGNMTAGNQVKITRDFAVTTKGKTVIQHSRLTVDYDGRIASGDLDMPGLPKTKGLGDGAFETLSWREVEP